MLEKNKKVSGTKHRLVESRSILAVFFVNKNDTEKVLICWRSLASPGHPGDECKHSQLSKVTVRNSDG